MSDLLPSATPHPRSRRDLVALAIVWAISQLAHYAVLGVRAGGDTLRDVDAAQRLLDGEPLSSMQMHKLAYDALLAVSIRLTGGVSAVVVVQVLTALACAGALYVIGRRLYSADVGLLAALVYLVNPQLQRWNFFVLSESIGSALVVLLVATVVCDAPGWVVLGTSGLLALTRTEGVGFLILVGTYLVLRRRWIPALMLFALAGAVLLLRPDAYGSNLRMHWSAGQYIGFYPGLGAPSTVVLGARVFYHLLDIRPYYSAAHNAGALVFTTVVYALALGDVLHRRRADERLLLWGVFLAGVVVAVVTSADWDGRWLARVLPVLFVPAAATALRLRNARVVRDAPA